MKMIKRLMARIIVPIVVAIVILTLFEVKEVLMAKSIDQTSKYAWASHAGWINLSPTNGGVTLYSDHLEGYAWGENIGWIRVGTHSGGGTHNYANDSKDNYGVNIDTDGKLTGYAWGTNVGWINFNPTNGGVNIDSSTGELSGYAWGENIGWISFENTAFDVSTQLHLPGEMTQINKDGTNYSIKVPIRLTSGTQDIGSLNFSLNNDETCLTFNETDSDGDGTPDAIIDVQAGFKINANYEEIDSDGELDIGIYDIPVKKLTDGMVVVIEFGVNQACVGQNTVDLKFSTDPDVSFGNLNGQSASGSIGIDGPIQINIAPSDINLSNSRVDENAPIGTTIATLTSTDKNSSDSHTYSLVSGDGDQDNGSFEIVGNELKTKSDFDYETKNSYSIRVQSDDGKGGTYEKILTINIRNNSLLSLVTVGTNESHSENTSSFYNENVITTLEFTAQDNNVSTVNFSIDYDTNCLSFDSTDGNNDGIPDAITDLPQNFNNTVTFDANDSDGELDITLDGGSNTLSDGKTATISFTAKDSCTSGSLTEVLFSDNPAVILNNTAGTELSAETETGTGVRIFANDPRGDCNSDGKVDAGDTTALPLEIFDNDDGTSWLDVYKGDFPGSPKGCDANADKQVDMADVICTNLIITGQNSCSTAQLARRAGMASVLSVGQGVALGDSIRVPIKLTRHRNAVAAASFSFHFEEEIFSFDPTDSDGNGIPDAITFQQPNGALNSATFDAEKNQLNFIVGDTPFKMNTLNDGTIATITVHIKEEAQAADRDGNISANFRLTNASLSDTQGRTIPLTTRNRKINIK